MKRIQAARGLEELYQYLNHNREGLLPYDKERNKGRETAWEGILL